MKVRAAYLQYAQMRSLTRLQYHPDKNSSADAEEKFKDIRYWLHLAFVFAKLFMFGQQGLPSPFGLRMCF